MKVADLGLARDYGVSSGMTQERIVLGSPAYISPEGVNNGSQVDKRADFYALGVIGYEMCFGRKPYSGSIQDILRGHVAGTADFALKTEFSKPHVEVIKKLMSLDPDDRYQSGAELIADLAPISTALKNNLDPGKISKSRRRKVDASAESVTASGTGSSELKGLVSFFEDRVGSHISTHDGKKIVHSTARDRILVWILLIGVIAVGLIAWLFSAAPAAPNKKLPKGVE